MPLVPDVIAMKVESQVKSMLQKQFKGADKDNPDAEKSWDKLAKIAAETAKIIIESILTDAQVAPGIPTAGSPTAQVTTGPGKII